MLIIIVFNCNKYTEVRREPVSNITDICRNIDVSLQLLFYRSKERLNDQNTKLFLSIQQYIKSKNIFY